jgi:CTP:molybdopterin cytidylyltransferase MocA
VGDQELDGGFSGGSSVLYTLIPAAGASQRFKDAGYTTSKPFLPMNDHEGRCMVDLVVETAPCNSHAILVGIPGEDYHHEPLRSAIARYVPFYRRTKGQAETVRILTELLPEDASVLVINCDAVTDYPMADFVQECCRENAAVGVLTVAGNSNTALSYVKGSPWITATAEKRVISNAAVAGFYYFRRAGDLLNALKIQDNVEQGEQYLTPSLNHLVSFGVLNVPLVAPYTLTSWGTPEEYEAYLERTR